MTAITLLDKAIFLAIAILGMVIHIFGVKIPAFKTRTKVTNETFDYGSYFQDDLAAIICSIAIILVLLIMLPVILQNYKLPTLYIEIGFLFFGFTDSSIIIAKMGKADDKLNAVIDAKTNIADGITPPPAG